MMPTHTIVVGIGGTGAKCVEAVTHLAASGHAPKNIYAILIDQDRKNGNVQRCINALKAYDDLCKEANAPRKWFFSSTFSLFDKLLPLVPHEESKNFGAAIGLPDMTPNEQAVTRTLFLPCELNETLDAGYKKRAHMGSLLIQQMLDSEDQKKAAEEGLNFVIDKVSKIEKPHVVVYGSLFGGTGASGIVKVGKYFRDKMSNAIVKGVFLTPYFVIGKGSEQDKDANLVKSDADMQAVRIALQMYRDEIENSFHYVYVIGSEISQLDGEVATKDAKYGGKDQTNPSHVFELAAATIAKLDPGDTSDKYYTCVAETNESGPPLIISLPNYPTKSANAALSVRLDPKVEKLDPKQLVLARDFASMINDVKDNIEKSWWTRQPWVDLRFKTALVNWASMHIGWWNEMSTEKCNDHRWGKFPMQLDTQIATYSYSSYLSRHIHGKSRSDLAQLFEAIDSLKKHNIRRIKWAST